MKAVHVEVNSRTRPISNEGLASPKAKENLKEADGIINGDAKKAGEAVVQQNKIPAGKSPKK
jgi:hypothetical protein